MSVLVLGSERHLCRGRKDPVDEKKEFETEIDSSTPTTSYSSGVGVVV